MQESLPHRHPSHPSSRGRARYRRHNRSRDTTTIQDSGPSDHTDDKQAGESATAVGSNSGRQSQQTTPRRRAEKQPKRGDTTLAAVENTSSATESGVHPANSHPDSSSPRPCQPEPTRSVKAKAPSNPLSKLRRDRTGDDLTSTLTRELRTPPYPDCSICFCPIRPEHQTWACSPKQPSTSPDQCDVSSEELSQCCWAVFHLKCIQKWAEKSVNAIVEAWRARGEVRPGEWRCPGCQMSREDVPTTYWCFCHRKANPAPPRLSTPHSCAQPCSRPRSPRCEHSCPLPCHPGPCPPCAITVEKSCFCGGQVRRAKCSVFGSSQSGFFACQNVCARPLSCKNPTHTCKERCHPGPCSPCTATVQMRCWCGKETKVVECSQVKSEDVIDCVVLNKGDESQESWIGMFCCRKTCDRQFSCGQHTCSKPCHPPSCTPPPCPFDPANVTHCACGQHSVARSPSATAVPSDTQKETALLPARTSCASPLPVCSSLCSKQLPCGHSCGAKCHWGSCPPCTEQIQLTCRCRAMQRQVQCGNSRMPHSPLPEHGEEGVQSHELVCDRPCPAMRTCGRHRCGRICCPLAAVATAKRAKPKSKREEVPANVEADTEGLHECDLPCRRILSCGNHRCEKQDHKGPCEVCLKSTFEELACSCGRTMLEPPISCGTRLTCVHPCIRPPPACGHPPIPHACHEALIIAGADTAEEGLGPTPEMAPPEICPPCPFLTNKLCACGKKTVPHARCSQELVSCGTSCGRLLACGFHHCERLCHADECGSCMAVCGKLRKSCLPEKHPCTQICHAPSACPETEPCVATVTLTCPCGHLKLTAPCSGKKQNVQCNNDCAITKRNARLAEALGISDEKRDAAAAGPNVVWNDKLITYSRVSENMKFVLTVEKAFADFVGSVRQSQVLPHTTPERQKFVQDLASVYRIETRIVDSGPRCSIQLIRRVDTRVPVPLLSQKVTPIPHVGKPIAARLQANLAQPVGASRAWGMGTTQAIPTRESSVAWRVPSPVFRSDTRSPAPSYSEVGGTRTPPYRLGTPSIPAVSASPSVHVQRVQVAPEDIPDNWEDAA